MFIMQRRTDLWGPDGKPSPVCPWTLIDVLVAMEFDPDRFLDERLHKYLTPNPLIFCPFNFGARVNRRVQVPCGTLHAFLRCEQFTYNEVSFMVVRLLQRFNHFELDVTAQPPDTIPPPSWKSVPGRQSMERIWPKANLTMYAYVSRPH